MQRLSDEVRRKLKKAEDSTEVDDEDLDVADLDMEHLDFNMHDLLQVMIKHRASDLHLQAGSPPIVRIDGDLIPIGNRSLSDKDCKGLLFSIMTRSQRGELLRGRELDLAHSVPNARFRVNSYLQQGTVGAAIRMLRLEIETVDDLALPPVLKELVQHNHGLILVTGPAGSGKSTTLAALIDHINTERKVHIITIEDPIEYVHGNKQSLVTQREVGNDTPSFSQALKMALRQDPNVILIGEMRDPETIMTAVIAAETGHLVLSTLHTPNTIQAIDRIIEVFSGEQQKQFRLLLSNNLRGIISQRLLTRRSGAGRVPAVEVMVVTPTVASLILEGQTQDIYQYMVAGATDGMQTFTESLRRLYMDGHITREEALYHADHPTELRLKLEQQGPAASSSFTTKGEQTLMDWI
jgi:twitching motility protein PilT